MMTSNTSPAIEAPPNPPSGKQPLHLTDLPRELQKEIISHVPQLDLISVAVVSRHFRDLASAELYRSFHILFPDEDDPAYANPVGGLASRLDTFATSDYDYAKYVREVSLDTVSASDKAELSYKQYLANQSCGKFMNTLFLIALRRAKSLEKFKWDIRVELSRPVYKALHQIETLAYLHLRLQAGPSLYEPPSPLPLSSSSPSLLPYPGNLGFPAPTAQTSVPLYGFSWLVGNVPGTSNSDALSTGLTLPPSLVPNKSPKGKAAKKTEAGSIPSTLSGFKNLRTLAILDIDDLEVVPELRECIRNSQSTMTKLKLSFSTSLAMRARKPLPDIDSDDSDVSDEFQVAPGTTQPLPSFDDVSGPARTLRAQEERKQQETALGRIFGVEQPKSINKKKKKKKQMKDKTETETGDTAKERRTTNGIKFVNSIKSATDRLMKEIQGSGDISSAQKEILDTIEAAARKYVSEVGSKRNAMEQNGASNGESSGAAIKDEAATDVSDTSSVKDEPETETTLFKEAAGKSKSKDQGPNPEDIDIEAPLEDSFADDGDDADVESVEPGPAVEETANKSNGTHETLDGSGSAQQESLTQTNGLDETLNGSDDTQEDTSFETVSASDDAMAGLLEDVKMMNRGLDLCMKEEQRLQLELGRLLGDDQKRDDEDVKRQIAELEVHLMECKAKFVEVTIKATDIQRQIILASQKDQPEATRQLIDEYQRKTRGLGLHSLSIHLIPVKASVLSRAVNLRVLQSITLLNVGNQTPIWALLSRENQEEALPLRRIFTDNVCHVFLMFVQQLEEVHELYLLERPEKYKPETFAPKTTMGIKEIRQLALKKHMGSLKRLMIKNQNQSDMTWDLDQKAISLVCTRGGNLEELAVSMSIREIHILLRHISQLQNLRALHIIDLRNDDTCVWVMRETRKFVLDALHHYPELKLEWLAIDDDEHAERILRWKVPPKDKREKKVNGKGKEKAVVTVTVGGGSGGGGADSSDEDDEAGGFPDGTLIETVDSIHFYDIIDVKIFKREVVTGRL